MSWGQRLPPSAHPEGLTGNNVQNEINVHNLAPVTGQSYQLFLVRWYTFILLIPLAVALWEPARRRLPRLVYRSMPLWIGLLFLANYVVADLALRHSGALRTCGRRRSRLPRAPSATRWPCWWPPSTRSTGRPGRRCRSSVSLLAVLTATVVLRRLPQDPADLALEGGGGRVIDRQHHEAASIVATAAISARLLEERPGDVGHGHGATTNTSATNSGRAGREDDVAEGEEDAERHEPVDQQ